MNTECKKLPAAPSHSQHKSRAGRRFVRVSLLLFISVNRQGDLSFFGNAAGHLNKVTFWNALFLQSAACLEQVPNGLRHPPTCTSSVCSYCMLWIEEFKKQKDTLGTLKCASNDFVCPLFRLHEDSLARLCRCLIPASKLWKAQSPTYCPKLRSSARQGQELQQ